MAAAAFFGGRAPKLATHHKHPTPSNLRPTLLLHKVNYTR
jgi:hypothetical protein